MEPIPDILGRLALVPVVKIDKAEDGIPLGKALIAGGLPCAEITFRTQAAEEAIRRIASEFPELMLGAGTVLTVDQAKKAVGAGARFIVSPGFETQVIDWCLAQGVEIFPGVVTPTEIMAAFGKGLTIVKFFPAEAFGGIATIKALAAPFGNIRFIPTGGVNARNLADYLSLPAVHACGGSWMVESRMIAAHQFGEIARLTAEACAIVQRIRGDKATCSG